jgi:hypothetical protein
MNGLVGAVNKHEAAWHASSFDGRGDLLNRDRSL